MNDPFHWGIEVGLKTPPDFLLSSDLASVLFHFLQRIILVHHCHFDCHILSLDNNCCIAGRKYCMRLDVVTLIVDEVIQSPHLGDVKAIWGNCCRWSMSSMGVEFLGNCLFLFR